MKVRLSLSWTFGTSARGWRSSGSNSAGGDFEPLNADMIGGRNMGPFPPRGCWPTAQNLARFLDSSFWEPWSQSPSGSSPGLSSI